MPDSVVDIEIFKQLAAKVEIHEKRVPDSTSKATEVREVVVTVYCLPQIHLDDIGEIAAELVKEGFAAMTSIGLDTHQRHGHMIGARKSQSSHEVEEDKGDV